MEKLKKIVEDKKLKSATRIPKYGMRKLSIGLVSCTLGIITLAAPNVVSAQIGSAEGVESPPAISSPGEPSSRIDAVEASEKVNKEKTKPEATETPTSIDAAENENVSEAIAEETKETEEKKEVSLYDDFEPTQAIDSEDSVYPNETEENVDKLVENPKVFVSEGGALENNQPEENDTLERSLEETPESIQAGKNEKPREGTVTKDGQIVTNTNGSTAADEANVGDYRDSEVANNGSTVIDVTSDKYGSELEGVTIQPVEPSQSSDNKRLFGLDIVIDRANGQRTYTSIAFSTSGQFPITGSKIKGFEKVGSETVMTIINDQGVEEKIKVNFTPESQITIMDMGKQKLVTTELNEKDLKHINDKKNNSTVISFRELYDRPNLSPGIQVTGVTAFNPMFSVNPYPNENKNLELIKVEGKTSITKVPVKGQYIKTGAKITNLVNETFEAYEYDEATGEEIKRTVMIDDYSRITSEVYAPDGTVIDPKEAQAILITSANKSAVLEELQKDDPTATLNEGDIVFKMPTGAIQDEGSIFNNEKFKGIQNLTARFFARPRTESEFKDIIDYEKNVNFIEGLHYAPANAGTRKINHNGQDIVIANQGIARYDHYNKIGEITIQLDDTKYYDQTFDRIQNKGDTAYSNVLTPGQSITLKINSISDNDKGPSKSYEDMKNAKVEGLANGTIIEQFKEMAEKTAGLSQQKKITHLNLQLQHQRQQDREIPCIFLLNTPIQTALLTRMPFTLLLKIIII